MVQGPNAACPLESLGASPRDKSGYASTRSRAQPQACSRLLLKAPDKPMLGFEGSDEGSSLRMKGLDSSVIAREAERWSKNEMIGCTIRMRVRLPVSERVYMYDRLRLQWVVQFSPEYRDRDPSSLPLPRICLVRRERVFVGRIASTALRKA